MTVSRRSLLLAATAAPATGALTGIPQARAAEAAAAAPGRSTVPLRDCWRFALVNPGGITDPTGAYAGAAEPGYDDSGWREVAVPHDWSIELAPTTEHGTAGGTGFFPGGLGWYRLAFTLPPALAGKRISVEFDGVYMDSFIYCNGTEVGRHPYGYTGFALDLTDHLHTDGSTENVLAVKVKAGARRALGDVRHDAGDQPGTGRRPGADIGGERLRRGHGRRGDLAYRRSPGPYRRPDVLHPCRHRQGDRDP